MAMILSGGGGVTKNPEAYELFAENVDKTRPVLYIPFASVPENYADNYAKFVLTMAKLNLSVTKNSVPKAMAKPTISLPLLPRMILPIPPNCR